MKAVPLSDEKKPPQGAGWIKELVFGDVVNAPDLPFAVPCSWVKRPGAAEDFFDICGG